jgi:hypothetical protein
MLDLKTGVGVQVFGGYIECVRNAGISVKCFERDSAN